MNSATSIIGRHTNTGKHTKNGANFSSWSGDFLCTPEMAVVLQMPGFRDVFVNNAHRTGFGESFRQGNSSPEMLKLLTVASSTKPTSCSDNQCDSGLRCYCEKAHALFAATDDFCAFERVFHHLGRNGSATGICFLRMRQQRFSRTYDIFRLHARRIPGAFAKSFIEARLIPLFDAQLRLRTLETNKDGLTAKIIVCHVTRRADNLMGPLKCVVPVHKEYHALASALIDSRECLMSGDTIENAKRDLLKRIQRVDFGYDPIKNYLCCLFTSERSKVISELTAVLRGINDALVGKQVLSRIESKLQNTPFPNIRSKSGPAFQTSRGYEILHRREFEYPPEVKEGNFFSKSDNRNFWEPPVSPEVRKRLGDQSKERPPMPLRHERIRAHLKEFEHQASVFERRLPTLLKKKEYRNRFIVMFRNDIVDQDVNRRRLVKRTLKRFKPKEIKEIYIDRVTKKRAHVVNMDTIESES